MAVTAGWDRDAQSPNNFQQSSTGNQQTNQQGSQTTSGKQTQQTKGTQATSSFQQNLTQSQLQSLDSLIAQLQDTPNVGDAEMDKVAPLPRQRTASFRDRTGRPNSRTEWIDPLTGRTLDGSEAQRLTAERQVERERLQQEGGVTPGGTITQQANQAARQEIVNRLVQSSEDYSKEAAFTDAQALIQQVQRTVLEQTIPSITRAAEGAGTSQSAVRGLFINDAASRAAEAAGVAGLGAAAQYGQIANQSAGILGDITSKDPVVDSLIQLLNVAKGSVQVGSNVTKTDQTTTTDTQQKQQTQQQANQIDLQDVTRKATDNTAITKFLDSSIDKKVTF